MPTENLLAKLYESPKTVLTVRDIALLWGETNNIHLFSKLKYYVKQRSLIRLTRGVFAKNVEYEVKELATSIYTPSYISFETVLREAGMIFQHQAAIFVASPYSTTKKINGHTVIFRKLKDTLLYNNRGVAQKNNCSIATAERAFLDTLYLSPRFYFDNLRPLNWSLCKELAEIYDNNQLIMRVDDYQKYVQ